MSCNDALREEAGRYLVVTDGVLTEATYFSRLNQLVRDTIVVKKQRHFADLLSVACNMKDAGGFDRVFIVCDIDEHCKNQKSRDVFNVFIRGARDAGITVVCSHESFEVWLLCHKATVPSECKDRKIAQKIAEELGLLRGNNAKLIVDREVSTSSIKRASREAKRLRRAYGGNVLEDGPTTDVDKIIDLLDFGDIE